MYEQSIASNSKRHSIGTRYHYIIQQVYMAHSSATIQLNR